MQTIIDVRNLTKEYSLDDMTVPILKGITFKIAEGEHISIMGPSGSGKSTLMHILGFLDRPSGGEYYFRGKDISAFGDDELARMRNQEIGFVFQSFNLLNRTTVLENVILPRAYSGGNSHKEDGKQARDIIASVGLSHRLNSWPSQLSGGEQQRVAIARALMNNPTVIFADEPTGNLDSKSGEQVMKILHDLHEKGHTIILVTHDINIAKQADRILYLKDGAVIKDERLG